MNKKFFSSALSLKSIGENGIFSGYASVFNIVDEQDDVILPGAFTETILKKAGRIKLLWQHQHDEPIGNILEINENKVGLYIVANLLLDLQKAREAYVMLKSGTIDSLSIGYVPLQYDVDQKTGVRALNKVDLWEVSLVTFPANSHSRVINIKDKTKEEVNLIYAIEKAKKILKCHSKNSYTQVKIKDFENHQGLI
ncbi:HK97 family phage prohead protease [Candidatus Mesenet endosymbiont of Agriotes lineatus]|uniref:HK97 family phage prohead protease n=1 Tax=Candidatus Mesenet endosymbiont of Agriotes lineatus TaxID=3077948 RepID=UPI0030CB0317